MASPFKHIAQIKSLDDFTKLTKQALDKVGEEPVKVQYFAKFSFDKKEAPLMLVGDIPTPVLVEVKKAAGTPVLGQCSANPANQLVFEGAVKSGMARNVLAILGIQRVVAADSDEEEEGGENQTETPTSTAPQAPKTVPVAPPKTPTSTPMPTAIEEKKTANKPPATKPPAPPPLEKAGKAKPRIPKPGVTKEMLAAKDDFSDKIRTLYPSYQLALEAPGAPVADLRQLFKAAGDAAIATKYKEAQEALTKLQNAVTAALEPKSPPVEDEAKESDAEEQQTAYNEKGGDEALLAKEMAAWKKRNATSTATFRDLEKRRKEALAAFEQSKSEEDKATLDAITAELTSFRKDLDAKDPLPTRVRISKLPLPERLQRLG